MANIRLSEKERKSRYPLHLIGSFSGWKGDIARQFDLEKGMATNFGDGDALQRVCLKHTRDQIPRLN